MPRNPGDKDFVTYVEDIDSVVTTDEIRLSMENLPAEKVYEKFISFDKWFPILERFGDPDDMTADEMISRATPLSVAKLIELMMTSSSEKIQMSCATNIAHMGGMKPVEKHQSVNVNIMAREEAVSLLESKLEKYGIEVIDGESVEEDIKPG